MTIRITGPESSGKTTLARALAEKLGGVYVPEMARSYLEKRKGQYVYADLAAIWEAQSSAEDAARATGANYVICDTGPEVICLWAEVKYGRCPAPVIRACAERIYDQTLLCYPDLPWEPDPLRETPKLAERISLFRRYEKILEEYSIITGTNRLRSALSLISNLTPP